MEKASLSSRKFRIEKDSIGEVKVPFNVYYGSFTTRALENFHISNIKAPAAFKKSLALIKKAAAITNEGLQVLDSKKSKAIQKAADELIEGAFNEDFQLDIFQAGAGTPFHMNTNEILANRANEILGGKKGTYEFVHPNNHVNMSQSSNDVIPTAIRLTMLLLAPSLIKSGKNLTSALQKKSKEFKKILKTGRTHLQDAVPVTLGQEFASFKTAITKDLKEIESAMKNLQELGIGGTALGTGINTHPEFQKKIVKNLGKLTKLKLTPTKNLFETTSNMNAFLKLSSSYRMLATTLQRIAEDLKLLGMSVLNEIFLPDVEPGSSIMPGKINPSVPECLQMIAYQVIGNDTAVALACQKGQLELNVMTPLILKNLTESTEILTSGMHMFQVFCIEEIQPNKERCQELLEKSNCVVTALSPHLGYAKTAELMKEALKRKIPIEKLCEEKKVLPKEKLREILDAGSLTAPRRT